MDKKINEDLKKRYDGVSASSIGLIKVSPKYYRNYVDRVLEEDTPKYFEIGTQTHMYLLENDKFKESYAFLDFTKPKGETQRTYCEKIAQEISEGTKVNKEVLIQSYKNSYAAGKKSDDKILEESKKLYKQLSKYINYLITRDKFKEILSYSTHKYLVNAEYAVKSHIKAKELLFSENDLIDNSDIYIANEKRILWEHPTIMINGKPMVCKSFLDRLEINFKSKVIKLIDLKTSSNLPEFENKFQEYKYYRQMAFYWMSINYLFETEFKEYNLKDFSFETYAVVLQTPHMQKDYPIVCKVFPISEESLKKGYEEINDLLNEIKWHTEENKWEHGKSYYINNGLEKIL